jgi:hypothetical protein
MTVHICQVRSDTYQSNTIWYKYLNSKKKKFLYICLGMMMKQIVMVLDQC